MVSTRRISARPSPRRTVGASGGVMRLAPGAQLRGDVLAVGRQHFLGIAAAGQFALVQPPDFVGQAAHAVPLRATPAAWWRRRGVGGRARPRRVRARPGPGGRRCGRSAAPAPARRFSASSGPSQRTSPDALTEPDAGFPFPRRAAAGGSCPEPFSPMMPTTVPSGATTSRFSSGALVTLRNARDINVRITTAHDGRSQSTGAHARRLERARRRRRQLLRGFRPPRAGRRGVLLHRRRHREGPGMGPASACAAATRRSKSAAARDA